MGCVVNEPFYANAKGERRALQEQTVLASQYPDFEMDIDDDGIPYVHGWIGPNPSLKGRYHILLLMPPGYGHGVMPIAHVLEPTNSKVLTNASATISLREAIEASCAQRRQCIAQFGLYFAHRGNCREARTSRF